MDKKMFYRYQGADEPCECGDCGECMSEFDFTFDDEEPTEREIEVAQFNYECMVYNEPEKIMGI